MDRLEKEYFELISIVDEAKELMETAMNELQKMPGELFNISTKMHGGINSNAEIDRKYQNLADKVRHIKVQLPEFKRRWNAISDIFDENVFVILTLKNEQALK